MTAANAVREFQARLIRHADFLFHQGILPAQSHEIYIRAIKVLGDDERARYEVPSESSHLAKHYLEELQTP